MTHQSSLDPILAPRAVAVIGASRDRASIGWALLHNLLLAEFEGPIYPINPNTEIIHSLHCYPNIGSVPGPVDLAVIVVPAAAVEATIDACLTANVRGLVVISAGFAETGVEGAAVEARICAKVRAADARMVGPNGMGVINTACNVRLNATFAPERAVPGPVGFVSQSGALGVAILGVAADLGLGLTQFVSVGNKADVSGNDLLEYWEHDEATRIVAMYLESFGNPRKFTQIAKRVSRRKPILMVKSGRTEDGARAASSHTGALAGSDVTVSAFLDQCGVVRADSIEELFDFARAFERCPLPAGPRIAIVTNAGGPAIMATDACVGLGLTMAKLGGQTIDALKSFLPVAASVTNPVDMIASATANHYRRALTAVLADPGVDLAMTIFVTPMLSDPGDIFEAITEAARSAPAKPVLPVLMASDRFFETVRARRDLLPVYRFPEPAVRALAKLNRYAAWRRQPTATGSSAWHVDDRAVAAHLATVDQGYLPADAAFGVLEAYGIDVVPWRFAPDCQTALDAAEALGYPLVLKADAPTLVHKSDDGGVALDLRSPSELTSALDIMKRRLATAGHRPRGYLMQALATGGREVIFGISTDERLGPILMFGLGGRYVEVLRDVRFAVPPITVGEARLLIEGLRGFALLSGVRGEPAVDLDQLVEVLLRLAQLVDRHPRIRALDINPYLATPAGTTAGALDVRIQVG